MSSVDRLCDEIVTTLYDTSGLARAAAFLFTHVRHVTNTRTVLMRTSLHNTHAHARAETIVSHFTHAREQKREYLTSRAV